MFFSEPKGIIIIITNKKPKCIPFSLHLFEAFFISVFTVLQTNKQTTKENPNERKSLSFSLSLSKKRVTLLIRGIAEATQSIPLFVFVLKREKVVEKRRPAGRSVGRPAGDSAQQQQKSKPQKIKRNFSLKLFF